MSKITIVTKRFVEVVKYLQREKVIKSLAGFAKSIEYKPQSLNEVLKERRNIPQEQIRKLVTLWDVSPEYLFHGEGVIIKDSEMNVPNEITSKDFYDIINTGVEVEIDKKIIKKIIDVKPSIFRTFGEELSRKNLKLKKEDFILFAVEKLSNEIRMLTDQKENLQQRCQDIDARFYDLKQKYEPHDEGKILKEKNKILSSSATFNDPDSSYKKKEIRALVVLDAKSAAGFPKSLNEAHYHFENSPSITLPLPQFKSGNYVVIQIEGSSMEPIVMDNDWVLIRKVDDKENFVEGRIFIVVNGDDVTLKRVYKEGDTRLKLVSDNSEFSTQIIPQSKRIQLWSVEMRFTTALGKNPIVAIQEQLSIVQTQLSKLLK